ncbi:MAG: drug/metabolite transporter (DMT)-like permease [Desulforhopalus sp.]|jgi:drug/metabolite transporter (DMT)-like permease
MKPEIKSMTSYEWLLLTILSIVWGGSFVFVGVAVGALPPLTIIALRVSLATFALMGGGGIVHWPENAYQPSNYVNTPHFNDWSRL